LCYKNPCRGIPFSSKAQKYEKKVYTDTEIQMVEHLAADRMPEVVILLETGLRRGELLGLQWQDIDFSKGTLSVKRSIACKKGYPYGEVHPPKKDSYRTIPLSQKAIQTLRSLERNGEYLNGKTLSS